MSSYTAAFTRGDTLFVNFYEDAEIDFVSPGGQLGRIRIEGGYPASANVRIDLQLEKSELFILALRIPGWSGKKTAVYDDGVKFLPKKLFGDATKPAPSWKITLESRNVFARLVKDSQEPRPCLWNFHLLSMGLVPGSGRFPGEGNGNPLQCSCLENPRDGGAWWAAVYGVTQSRTQGRGS